MPLRRFELPECFLVVKFLPVFLPRLVPRTVTVKEPLLVPVRRTPIYRTVLSKRRQPVDCADGRPAGESFVGYRVIGVFSWRSAIIQYATHAIYCR